VNNLFKSGKSKYTMIKKRVPATLQAFRNRLKYYQRTSPGKYRGITNEAGIKMRIEATHTTSSPRPYIGRLLLEKSPKEVRLNKAINYLQKKHKLTRTQAVQRLITDFNKVQENCRRIGKRFKETYHKNPDLLNEDARHIAISTVHGIIFAIENYKFALDKTLKT